MSSGSGSGLFFGVSLIAKTLVHKQAKLAQSLGSRDGAVVRALASHQCGPGSILGLGVIPGLSLLLVLVFSPSGFSPGTPVFPSPKKNQQSASALRERH